MTSNTWLSALKEKIEEENINIHNTDDDYREGEREDVWAGDDRNGKAGEFFTECVPEEPTKPTKAPLHPSKNTESLDQRAYETYKRSEGLFHPPPTFSQ